MDNRPRNRCLGCIQPLKLILFWTMLLLAACTGGEAQSAPPETQPIPVLPTFTPTPLPTDIPPLEGITFTELKRFGNGYLLDFAFHPSKNRIAIGGTLGIYIYDYLTSEQIIYFPSKVSRLRGIAWSPDGSMLASGGEDGAIQIWDTESNGLILEFNAHSGRVETLEWSPLGNFLASSGEDDFIRVWDAVKGHQLTAVVQELDCCSRFNLFVNGPAWSPNGEHLALHTDNSIILVWDVPDWDDPREVEVSQEQWDVVYAPVSWSRDSKLLALGNLISGLVIVDVHTGKVIEEVNVHPILTSSQDLYWTNFGGKFSPKNDQLAHWDAHDVLHILDTNTWEELPPIQWEGEIISKAGWAHDGEYIGVVNYGGFEINIFKLESRELISTLRLEESCLQDITWSPNGSLFPIMYADRELWLISSQDLEIVETVDYPGEYLWDLFWVDDGETIGGYSYEFGYRYVWATSLSGGYQKFVSKNGLWDEHFMGITEDGNLVGGRIISDETEETWDTQPSSEIVEFIWRQYPDRDIFQAPQSTIYAGVLGDTIIRVWEYPSGDEIALLEGHNESIDFMQWSPQGNLIASVDEGGTLHVWDIDSEQILLTEEGIEYPSISLVWSPDELVFAAGDHQGNVYVWDIGDQERIKHFDKGTKLIILAWSPDGRLLAMGDHLGLISIMDRAAWQEIAQLVGHTSMIYTLSWSPDGGKLLSGSSDGTVRVWGLQEE
ncbi:MAG: hypothetical protein OEV06_07035 [Anaerolineae bacterium]|nr:hypothetical protein [Anaerolineae bacterium]